MRTRTCTEAARRMSLRRPGVHAAGPKAAREGDGRPRRPWTLTTTRGVGQRTQPGGGPLSPSGTCSAGRAGALGDAGEACRSPWTRSRERRPRPSSARGARWNPRGAGSWAPCSGRKRRRDGRGRHPPLGENGARASWAGVGSRPTPQIRRFRRWGWRRRRAGGS